MISLDPCDLELAPPARLREEFRQQLRDGLRRGAGEKFIPCKYLYDTDGSRLFEQICAQPEYYPTRTESWILERHAADIAAIAGEGCALVELGSGSSRKTRLVLDRLVSPAAYVPVDISAAALALATRAIRRRYPALPVLPVCADYTHVGWHLPELATAAVHRLFFFPGSTVGNFEPEDAMRFLRHLRHKGTPGDGLLVGVDLVKAAERLVAAYNDAAGVTAAFNLNLLERANRELNANFDPTQFVHEAVFDTATSRIEMRLVSRRTQDVHIAGEPFAFAAGEVITTEYSYKYELRDFRRLAREAGFTPSAVWTDPERLFSVHYLTA
jgi:dimethylhistidine N-methyltransferase